jgi:hypothetical protein
MRKRRPDLSMRIDEVNVDAGLWMKAEPAVAAVKLRELREKLRRMAD